jgi:hypothetical protein
VTLERDIFYESRGKAVHPTWQQNFEDHESRLTRAWRRVAAGVGLLQSYLTKDGQIPGPLAGERFRQLELRSSLLPAGNLLDFKKALCIFVRLEAATTAFQIGLPTLAAGQCVHAALCLQQDATGGRLATYSSNLIFDDFGAPDLTAAAAESVTIIHGIADGTRGVMRVAGITSYAE